MQRRKDMDMWDNVLFALTGAGSSGLVAFTALVSELPQFFPLINPRFANV
jgi:hypothetical protein